MLTYNEIGIRLLNRIKNVARPFKAAVIGEPTLPPIYQCSSNTPTVTNSPVAQGVRDDNKGWKLHRRCTTKPASLQST